MLKFSNCSNFNILLWFLINLITNGAFVSAATADTCSIVYLVCLFMKTHLLVLMQGLDLLRCAFLSKLSGCVRNLTAFCQHLLRPILSAVLADTDTSAKPKYRPGRYIGLSLPNTPKKSFILTSHPLQFTDIPHQCSKLTAIRNIGSLVYWRWFSRD